MADQRITFDFSGKSSGLVSETKKVQKELDELERKSKGFGQQSAKANQDGATAAKQNAAATQGLGGGVAELAGKYFLVLQALQAVMGVGKGVYGSLIQQNEELKQQIVSTGAALSSTNKVFKAGVEVTDPAEALAALEQPVDDAIARIREKSLDVTGITSQQLIPVFQTVAASSGEINATLDESADLTVKLGAALRTFQIPLEQQRQEVKSILDANISSDSVLANSLNITSAMVRQWKAQGTAVAELNKRLEASAVANKLNSQTITGYASNIEEIFQNITLAAGKDLTAEITADLGEFYKFLVENKDEIQKFVTEGADLILSLIQNFKEAGTEIGSNLGPELAQLGEITQKLGPIFSTVALGLEKLLILASDNPQFQAFLTLTNGALTAVQAIGSLNGEYAAGTEAAEEYGKRTASVAEEAIAALGKIKRSDTDATAAKKEAIAKINDQLQILKESNVVGTENRAVIKTQIAELETYKGKLEGSGGAIKLVSKDTSQLISDLKLLTEQFDAQGKAAELAQARLTAAVKRQRTGDKAISAREEQNQLYQIEQEGLNKRLQLAQEKADGIAAIAAKGGDAEQQKEFTKQLTAAQLEGAKIEGEIAEKTLARKKAIQDRQLKDLETYQAKANDAIASSESALLLQAEQGYQADLTQKQRYEALKLAAAQDRVLAEIKAENERTQALSKLKFDDPDEREANEAKIRASKQKTAALTLKSLENQRQIEQSIAEIRIKQISDRAAAEKRANDESNRQLTEQKTKYDQITQSIERQNKLRTAQNNLAKAQTDLLTTGASIQTSALDRALELRKRLNDETTSPEVQRVLRQQLEALTGNRDTSEVTILQRKIALENNIARIKAIALADEQAAARNALAVETQRNELAARRAVIESKIAETNARTALGEAKKNLTELQQTPGADPRAIADAQQAIREAQSNVGAASGNVQAAQADLEQQKALAPLEERKLAAQQASALAQQQAAEFARQQAAQLTIVEAKSQAIAAGQKAVRFNAADFTQIRIPSNINAAATSGGAINPGKAEGLLQLQLKIMQDSLVQLTRLANREPARPTTPQQIQSRRGEVLRGTGL